MLFAKQLVLLAVLLVGVPSATQGLQQASQATCSGSDNSVPAKCFLNDTSLVTALPLAYQRARAVARLQNSKGSCTGFLVGSEGHLLTAAECIPTSEDAANTIFEFGAESASCEDQCQVESGCPGTIVRRSAEFVTSSATFAYTLVKLASGPDLAQYGYLQIGSRGPGIYEKIYIPSHPGSYAKRITAYTTGTTPASIQAISALDACRRFSMWHNAFLQPGAVGAPLLSWTDSTLSGLSTCASCTTNGGYSTATDIRKIIGDLDGKSIRIKDFKYDASTTPPPTTTAPPSTTTEPTPTSTAPPPTTTAPPPTTTEPSPTATTPAPTSAEPSPTTTAPPPTTDAPTPTSAVPSPTTTEPSPTTTEPSPTTTEPSPTTTEPSPTTTAPPPPSPTTRAPFCT